MPVELQRRRFTVDDYYAMSEAGIIGPEDRVELIDGDIIEMGMIGTEHAACVDRLNRLLGRGAEDNAIVRVQGPIWISDLSMPQPDVTLLRPRPDFYADSHPRPADIVLVVEVAHSTLAYDREIKLPLYALAGVPEFWIVNVDDRVVEVHREPSANGYLINRRAWAIDVLQPSLVPSVMLRVEQILGERRPGGPSLVT